MHVKPLRPTLIKYLKKHNLEKKYSKQFGLFKNNPLHPSLNTEKLEPASARLYSFRIDRKYRVIFGFHAPGKIEIIDINDHYR